MSSLSVSLRVTSLQSPPAGHPFPFSSLQPLEKGAHSLDLQTPASSSDTNRRPKRSPSIFLRHNRCPPQHTHSLFLKPGLSAYATDPKKAADSLLPLLKSAEKAVPKDMRQNTPVIVGATTGLRQLGVDASEEIGAGMAEEKQPPTFMRDEGRREERVILCEIANFAAYAFAPAILVTPLGALIIIVR